MVAESRIEVRYADCDSMGIVHHAVYPVWFEIGRMDFFAQTGCGYPVTHAKGLDPAMVNLNITYNKSVSFPCTVTLKTKAVLCERKKIRFEYAVFAPGESEPVVTAQSFHIWVHNGKGCNLQEEHPEIFNVYADAVEA